MERGAFHDTTTVLYPAGWDPCFACTLVPRRAGITARLHACSLKIGCMDLCLLQHHEIQSGPQRLLLCPSALQDSESKRGVGGIN